MYFVHDSLFSVHVGRDEIVCEFVLHPEKHREAARIEVFPGICRNGNRIPRKDARFVDSRRQLTKCRLTGTTGPRLLYLAIIIGKMGQILGKCDEVSRQAQSPLESRDYPSRLF